MAGIEPVRLYAGVCSQLEFTGVRHERALLTVAFCFRVRLILLVCDRMGKEVEHQGAAVHDRPTAKQADARAASTV
jgi:hypothetical protein